MENSSKKTTKKEDHKNNKRIPSKKVIFKREKELITQHIFPIVAVGGSAGGLEAFKKLIEKLPVDIGMAFVFIAHLDPNSPSNLKQILQYSTSLAVAVIEDSQQITPNTIYVLPPNTFVTMFNNKLKLSPRPSNKDYFYR